MSSFLLLIFYMPELFNVGFRLLLQARRDASRPAPAIPLPFAPKQDLPRKDVSVTEHRIAQETYIKSKKDVQVTFVSPTQAHKPSALPTPGLSVPLPSNQQNVSLQFGGPNRQIQSQGMPPASLQRPIQMGNPSQVPQPVFVSAVQRPLMQTQGIMHHGQNTAFHSQLTPQHPHQSGNVGLNISTQYNQQKAGKYDSPRKTVKITHPDTHEELRLDSRDGGLTASRGHQNGPSQSQPVSAYTGAHPMGYYPNSYPTGLPFFPAQSSHPLTSAQLNASPQAPRFNYSVSQTPPTMPFMNPSVSNTYSVPRVGASLHGAADSSNLNGVRDAQTVVPSSQSSSDPVIVKRAAGEVIKSNAASIPSQNASSVTPAVPGSIPRESSAIMQADIAKKETVTKSVSVRDVDKQLGKLGHPEPSLQVILCIDIEYFWIILFLDLFDSH